MGAAAQFEVSDDTIYSARTENNGDRVAFQLRKCLGEDHEVASEVSWDFNRETSDVSIAGKFPKWDGVVNWFLGTHSFKTVFTKEMSKGVTAMASAIVPMSTKGPP